MDTIFAAMNRTVVIIEAVVVLVIVALVIGIIVSSRRRKKASMPKPAAEVPNYYADLKQQPSGRPDPFGTFAASASPTPSPLASFPSASAPSGAFPAASAPPGAFASAASVPTPSADPSGAALSAPGPLSTSPISSNPLTTSPFSTNPLIAGSVETSPTFSSAPAVPAASVMPDLAPHGTSEAPRPVSSNTEPQGIGAYPSWPPDDTWSSGAAASTVGATALDPQTATAAIAVASAPRTPSPPTGTAAGWLPDPSGTPDTLRYWDGITWTQHFAQRS